MDSEFENIIMTLVVESGSARSYAMEAIQYAKAGDFEAAKKSLQEADEVVLSAHHVQTDLIQKEARGEQMPVSLLMLHAQDHLMSALLAIDLAKEMVELHEIIKNHRIEE